MKTRKNTKLAAMLALIVSLACALIASVTLLAMPKTVITTSAETEDLTPYSSITDAINDGAVTQTEADGKVTWVLQKGIKVPTVYISGDVTLDLNGKTLSNDGTGSVIYINYGKTFTLNDSSGDNSGKITGGIGRDLGYYNMYGGGGVYMDGETNFIMNGGKICGNTANEGSGVEIGESGNFTMTGGEISGNFIDNSRLYGGGIYVFKSINISGTAKVFNNINTYHNKPDNIYLEWHYSRDIKINITGELSDEALLHVTLGEGHENVITTNYDSSTNGENPAKYFRADNGNVILLNDDGEAYISDTVAAEMPTISASEFDGTTPVKIEGYDKETMEVSGLPEGWTIADDGTITVPENAEAKEYPFTVSPKNGGYWSDGTQDAKDFKITVKGSGSSEGGGNTGDNPGGSGGDNTGDNPGGSGGDNTGDNPGGNGGGNTGDIGGSGGNGGGNTDSGNEWVNSPVPWVVLVIVILVISSAITFTCVLIDRKNRKKNK